jgi:chloride channel 7
VLTALVACSLDLAILQLANVKFGFLANSIGHCIENDCLLGSFFLWIAFDVALVTTAGAVTVFYAPVAQGSGIPEVRPFNARPTARGSVPRPLCPSASCFAAQVKCFLNGIKMPEVVRLKTLLVKGFGACMAPLPAEPLLPTDGGGVQE